MDKKRERESAGSHALQPRLPEDGLLVYHALTSDSGLSSEQKCELRRDELLTRIGSAEKRYRQGLLAHPRRSLLSLNYLAQAVEAAAEAVWAEVEVSSSRDAAQARSSTRQARAYFKKLKGETA